MQDLTFEKALEKLEIIVEELEKGDLTLDQALERYEEGVRLSRFCSKKLEEVEARIEMIIKEGEEIKKVPFEKMEEVE
ncbi:exodeoxyribonuclease VII small subunit [Anoxybacter fermentans]|uniref:Exodeoxyribonuclease 7 small subunit n=1 Tax=Anoxybacter fermentans TaxID=1323375 RepID=A0A3S9SZ35_9FIRM|nr:exodeoxyribonuclease VII small subunit [Anoxybacter fermentans]AZR73520.1 exodeoxyribonuclease VII small subunit [Anoxybacter fermentans]